MKIYSINALKGGAGKSTITSILINSLTIDHHYKCLLVECDDQGTLTDIRKLEERKVANAGNTKFEFPYSIVRVKPEQVEQYLIQQRDSIKEYDLIFVETPGTWNENLEKALLLCDGILIPVTVNLADKMSILKYLNILKKILQKKTEDGFEFIYYAVRNKKVLNSAEERVFDKFLVDLCKLDVFTTSLRDLAAYKKITTMYSYGTNKEYRNINMEVRNFVEEYIEKFEIPVKEKI